MHLSLIFLVSLVILVVKNNPVQACECAEMTPEQSLAVIGRADLIFEGTVTSFEEREQPEENFDYSKPMPVAENPLYARARLKIDTLYKGDMEEGRRVTAYIDTMTSCGHLLQLGDMMAFVLDREGEDLVQAGICDEPLPQHWDDLKAGKFKTEGH